METTTTGNHQLDSFRTVFANRPSQEQFNFEEYADFLRMEIGLRQVELRRIRAQRSTLFGRLVRLIRWASQPGKGKPRMIPGPEMEFAVIGLHVLLVAGHIVLTLRG